MHDTHQSNYHGMLYNNRLNMYNHISNYNFLHKFPNILYHRMQYMCFDILPNILYMHYHNCLNN